MKDLTKGNPYKLILLFMLPVFLGGLFQQLYSMADTVIVGRTVGAEAFTGVGLTASVTFLIIGFANGLTSGFGVRISNRYGAGDMDGVRRAIATGFTLCIIITGVLTAIATPLAGPILKLMRTPAQYYDYAYGYLVVVFGGMGATIFYNMIAGTLRAVGDSKTPLFFLILSAFLNIGLDFAFILGCKLYYHGAALATILSQFLSGGACLIYMLKRYPALRLKRADWAWDLGRVGGHLAVGLPMALQFSITAVGMIIQQSALNGLDAQLPGAVTGYAAAAKIDNLLMQAFGALGTAMATYTGQNTGAGQYGRIRKGARVGMVYSVAITVFSVVFVLALGKPFIGLFLSGEEEKISPELSAAMVGYGQQFLLYQTGSFLFLGVIHTLRNVIQGMGKSAVTIISGALELGGRVCAAFVFVKLWAFTGVCISDPLAWLCADVFLIVTYIVVMRRALRGQSEKQPEPMAKAA